MIETRPIALCLLTLLLALAAPTGASAANWEMIQGTEEGRPDKPLQPFGFLQVLAEGVIAGPVEGLESDALDGYNGELAAFNILSRGDAPWRISVRRARLGVRGSIPKTDQTVNYFFAAELGTNGATIGQPIALMDASLTFNAPFLRVRAGQFKLPAMDETLEAVHVAGDRANYSIVARQLVLERSIQNGRFQGAVNGFRDVGIQLFDAYKFGDIELSWAAMGASGRPGPFEFDRSLDGIGRLQVSWLLGDRRQFHPKRDELSGFVWGQAGSREVDGEEIPRLRVGGGTQLRTNGWRARLEAVWADGVLPAGTTPPFAGNPIPVLADATAVGGTTLLGYRPTDAIEFDLFFDVLHRRPEDPAGERLFADTTLGVQWFISSHAKLMANAALRHIGAPNASTDVQRIISSIGPRFSLQATGHF